jgi:hypothetical protein
MTKTIRQIGGSLDDFISSVRRSFEATFNKGKQPDNWLWVRDVFEHYVIAREGDQYWQIGMKVGDATTFDARSQWKKVSLDYVAQMAGEEHRGPVHEMIVTEFKGKFPDIPVPDEVLSGLKEIDPAPFFMSLEVSRSGMVSRSGLEHDDALGESIVRQINDGVKTGIMGHLREEDRRSAYPLPDSYWVGATQHNGSSWAKAYIPKSKEAVREHYRVLIATNGRAATSIYGAGVRQMTDAKKGTYRLKEFRLEQLDLAPYERAALPLDGKWTITAQMSDETGDEHDMTREELITQLTADDVPVALREQIVQEWQVSQGQEDRVKQLEQELAEANKTLDTLSVKEFNRGLDAKIAELVTFDAATEEAKQKLAALRITVRRAVLAEMAGATELAKVEQALAQYTGGEEYQALSSAVVKELAGPNASKSGGTGRPGNWREELAEKAKDLRKQRGI